MAVSFSYRDAARFRKRKWRRFEVVFFFVLMASGLLQAGRPWTWTNCFVNAIPYLLVAARLMSWTRIGVVPITSLDDLAMEEYGVEFEQTTLAQQTDLLRQARERRQRVQGRPYYRVGAYTLKPFSDELSQSRERESHMRAYVMLRVFLPAFAIVYWAGWHFLPDGAVRAGWTDAPVVFAWIFLLILVLPQVLRMWMEPDDPAEPKLAIAARKEA
jgi:hypothetical protein